MSANGDAPKLQITCPGCKTVFSARLPKLDLLNGLYSSSITGAHPNLIKCIACGQAFVFIIEGAQVSWNAQVVGPEVVQQVEGSLIVKPGLLVPNKP